MLTNSNNNAACVEQPVEELCPGNGMKSAGLKC